MVVTTDNMSVEEKGSGIHSVFSHFSGDWPVSGRDIIGISNGPADLAAHITIMLVMGWPTVGLVS